MNTESPNPETSGSTPSAEPSGAAPGPETPASTPSEEAKAAGAVELPFQAEVQQVLHLVINSLYSNQEVFLRELVSNASDALDKVRFLALTREDVAEQAGEPRDPHPLDDDARTLTIEDNGIGMTRDEVVQNLGTIARSGTLEFLKASAEAAKQKKDGGKLQLIGQFGVGFYAAFMVAYARRRADPLDAAGRGARPVALVRRGLLHRGPRRSRAPGHEIVLHLKDDAREYTKELAVKDDHPQVLRFRSFPHQGERRGREPLGRALDAAQVADHRGAARGVLPARDRRPRGGEAAAHRAPVDRRARAVPRPALRAREGAGGHVPQGPQGRAPLREARPHRRGLRQADADVPALPARRRRLRGPLAERLARDAPGEPHAPQIEQQIVKQVLKSLKDLAESEPERYAAFWKEFGRVIKEGVTNDWKNKDAIAELCRFESMNAEAGKVISLRDYVAKMPEAQKEIYYVTGLGRRAVEQSPHLEAFRKRGYDVLFLVDPVDEWFVQSLNEFDKRRLKSVMHGDVDLGAEPEKKDEPEASVDAAVAAVKAALGDRVKDVRVSRRLTDSASCLVAAEGDPGANFERIMKLIDQNTGESKRILELNPGHPVVKNLNILAGREPGSERVKQWSELLLDQALLVEGVVQEPAKLVRRIQDLLAQVSSAAVSQP